MKYLLVGGTFDENNGKESGLITKILTELKIRIKSKPENEFYYSNGGNFDDFKIIKNFIPTSDVIFWFANIPNNFPKFDIKSINQNSILVSSKRNNNEYSFKELVERSLRNKNNLVVEFMKKDDKISMRIFDPLGNVWCDYTTDFKKVSEVLFNHTIFLKSITRQNATYGNQSFNSIPDHPDFFNFVKKFAEIAHTSMDEDIEEKPRFFGNSSFRCIKGGFPSFRDYITKDLIFVSARNTDKRYIDKDHFVPCFFSNDKLVYFNILKPSVDTPIQLRLYKKYPDINFMIHTHMYIKDPDYTTNNFIPCGGVQEFDEIINIVGDKIFKNSISINLKRHGCLIMSNTVEDMKQYLPRFVKRPFPEI